MTSPSSNLLRAWVTLLLLVAVAGCAEDLALDEAEGETQTIATEPLADGGFTTRVDASASDTWVYFSFVSGAQVIPLDPQDSSDWDLGFQRFHIITNGGASGNGGASVATLADQAFADVVAAPAEGYVADEPDSDDSDTLVDSAFETGDGWYAYDEMTNRLSPRPIVYVIRTARGAHYKLSILDYYDDAGSSGHPTFSWAEL
jgi:hypothetical protein